MLHPAKGRCLHALRFQAIEMVESVVFKEPDA